MNRDPCIDSFSIQTLVGHHYIGSATTAQYVQVVAVLFLYKLIFERTSSELQQYRNDWPLLCLFPLVCIFLGLYMSTLIHITDNERKIAFPATRRLLSAIFVYVQTL